MVNWKHFDQEQKKKPLPKTERGISVQEKPITVPEERKGLTSFPEGGNLVTGTKGVRQILETDDEKKSHDEKRTYRKQGERGSEVECSGGGEGVAFRPKRRGGESLHPRAESSGRGKS